MNTPQPPSELDRELRQLCEEVYERTGWGLKRNASHRVDLRYYRDDGLITDDPIFNDTFTKPVPLYTSDYLLEKLPWSTVCSGPNMGMFAAWLNGKSEETFQESDTPLKALLKLVIALDEAGELTGKPNPQ